MKFEVRDGGDKRMLKQRAKTLIRWGTLTLALSRAREKESGPLSRRERAGLRGSIVQLSAIVTL